MRAPVRGVVQLFGREGYTVWAVGSAVTPKDTALQLRCQIGRFAEELGIPEVVISSDMLASLSRYSPDQRTAAFALYHSHPEVRTRLDIAQKVNSLSYRHTLDMELRCSDVDLLVSKGGIKKHKRREFPNIIESESKKRVLLTNMVLACQDGCVGSSILARSEFIYEGVSFDVSLASTPFNRLPELDRVCLYRPRQ